MSEIWIPAAAGGGADLDVVTAQAGDVRNGKVIVGPDGEPLTGTMKEIGAKTYTPGKSNQVIAANQFLAGAQTIAGDSDLIPDNILYGKNIFGVSGVVRSYKTTTRFLEGSNITRRFEGFGPNDGTLEQYYATIDPLGFTPLFVVCSSYDSRYVCICSGPTWWGWAYTTSSGVYRSLKDIKSTSTFYMPVISSRCKVLFEAIGY